VPCTGRTTCVLRSPIRCCRNRWRGRWGASSRVPTRCNGLNWGTRARTPISWAKARWTSQLSYPPRADKSSNRVLLAPQFRPAGRGTDVRAAVRRTSCTRRRPPPVDDRLPACAGVPPLAPKSNRLGQGWGKTGLWSALSPQSLLARSDLGPRGGKGPRNPEAPMVLVRRLEWRKAVRLPIHAWAALYLAVPRVSPSGSERLRVAPSGPGRP
jgi:hypothetical protein